LKYQVPDPAPEGREHVEWLLHYYRDPAAKPRYNEALALLAECEAVAG